MIYAYKCQHQKDKFVVSWIDHRYEKEKKSKKKDFFTREQMPVWRFRCMTYIQGMNGEQTIFRWLSLHAWSLSSNERCNRDIDTPKNHVFLKKYQKNNYLFGLMSIPLWIKCNRNLHKNKFATRNLITSILIKKHTNFSYFANPLILIVSQSISFKARNLYFNDKSGFNFFFNKNVFTNKKFQN